MNSNSKNYDFPNSYDYYNSALSIPLFYDLRKRMKDWVWEQKSTPSPSTKASGAR